MTAPSTERSRRLRALTLVVAFAAVLALILWLAWPTPPAGPRPDRARTEPGPAPVALDAGAPALPEASIAVRFDARGRILVSSTSDGGVPPAELERVARGAGAHPARDLCREEPPGFVEAPDGAAVVRHGRVRAALGEGVEREAALTMAEEADEALGDAAELLDAPAREDLLLVLYPTAEAMEEALGEIGWAKAVYDGAVHVVAEPGTPSLRHEVMHAQLHQTAPCVPYWLDEGLAAWFEPAAARRRMSWLRMLHAHMWIPFSSLERPIGPDEGTEVMEPVEVALLYSQSMGMVSMLAERGGPRAIADAVARAAGGTPRDLLWSMVVPDGTGEALLDHFAEVLFEDVAPDERHLLEGAYYYCQAEGRALRRCWIASPPP